MRLAHAIQGVLAGALLVFAAGCAEPPASPPVIPAITIAKADRERVAALGPGDFDSLPYTGVLERHDGKPVPERMAPSIFLRNYDPALAYLVRVRQARSGEPVADAFVRPGEKLVVILEPGRYLLEPVGGVAWDETKPGFSSGTIRLPDIEVEMGRLIIALEIR